MRADHFKKDRPEDRVERNFAPRRRIIGVPEPDLALHPQERRQGAGHQEHVVEMKPEKGVVRVRLDAPTIERIERA